MASKKFEVGKCLGDYLTKGKIHLFHMRKLRPSSISKVTCLAVTESRQNPISCRVHRWAYSSVKWGCRTPRSMPTIASYNAVLIDCFVIYLFVFWLLNKGKAARFDIFLALRKLTWHDSKTLPNIYRDNVLNNLQNLIRWHIFKHRTVTGSQPEWMYAREVLFFFNFQDVTDKGDICQMVICTSI